MRHVGLAVLLALTSLQLQAQTYKWIDESGHTQYSDRPPPPGVKFEQIDKEVAPAIPPAKPAEANGQGSNPAMRELEFRKRQLEAAEKQKQEEQKEQEAKAKQDNCDSAKSRLKILTDGGRILVPNPSGGRAYMGDDEIEAERNKAQKYVDEACK